MIARSVALLVASLVTGCGALNAGRGNATTVGAPNSDGKTTDGGTQELVTLQPLTLGFASKLTPNAEDPAPPATFTSNVLDVTGYREVIFYGLASEDPTTLPHCTLSDSTSQMVPNASLDDIYLDVLFGLDAMSMKLSNLDAQIDKVVRLPVDGNFLAVVTRDGSSAAAAEPMKTDAPGTSTPTVTECEGKFVVNIVGVK